MKAFSVGLLRLAVILRVLARHGAARLLASRAASWRWLARRLPMAVEPPPERLRRLFEDLGGTFIKFGQMLALQPDILSVEHCNALFKLLDRVDPFPYSEVERIATEELGRPPLEIFDSFEREPLATASIGQVHVAWLGGEKVAVKVQRPNVEIEFGSDIRLMTAGMRIIRWLRLKPFFWILEPISEFIDWTREELDYRYEAGYSEHLRRLAAGNPGQVVPRVFGEYTTRRVLVVEFLEGTTLLDLFRARDSGDEVLIRRLEAGGFEPRRFAAHVIDNFLGNAFRDGIYHADLHPANLLVLRDSVVGYVDFGISGVISPYARGHIMKMTLALVRGDMDRLYDEFLEISVWDEKSDREGFRNGLDRLAASWYKGVGAEKRLVATFTRVMSDILRLSRRTRVLPERDTIKYVRSTIAADGLIVRFAPGFDLGAHVAETCSRYLRWQVRRNRFSAEKMLDFSLASAELFHDGAARATRLLDRLASDEVATSRDDGPDEALRGRALQLATAVFGASLLAAAAQDPALGFNLWTAELAFAATALAFLGVTLRRLLW